MLPRTSVTTRRHMRRGTRRSMRALLLVAVTLAGMCAIAVVSAGSADATVPRRTALERRIDWAVHALINTERAQHGLPPVRMNWNLRTAARRHNVTMARADKLSHQLPGEPYFGRRITNAGYRWDYAGENVGWNSDVSRRGALRLERLMYHEKPPDNGHRLNILSRHFRNVGVDVYVDEAHHKLWLTTDYAHHV